MSRSSPRRASSATTGEEVARLTARLWKDAPVPPLLSSFSFEALMAARQAAPHIPRGWLTSRIGPEDWERMKKLEAVSVHTDHKKLDLASVARAHESGYHLLAYTVNDADVAERLFGAGVDGLFTDNLREFARHFPEAIRAPA